jgi:predicted RNase H-like nuclease (RuvC/YqgF family)
MVDLAKFEERLQKLEFIHGRGASDTVREIQRELLTELYKLRDALATETPTTEVSQEATKELEALRDENQRLKYRVEHLKRHISTP